jgi:hypothetical protein
MCLSSWLLDSESETVNNDLGDEVVTRAVARCDAYRKRKGFTLRCPQTLCDTSGSVPTPTDKTSFCRSVRGGNSFTPRPRMLPS